MARKKMVHKFKANRYISFMVMSNTSKPAKVIRFPKWCIAALVVVFIGIGFGSAMLVQYINNLNENVEIARQDEEVANKIKDEQQIYIENLEATNEEQENKLAEIFLRVNEFEGLISKIQDMKDQIDEKIDSKGTLTQKDESSIEDDLAEMDGLIDREVVLTAAKVDTNASFSTRAEGIAATMDAYIELLSDKEGEYSSINTKIDELLPFWEAKPSGYPVSNTKINSPFGKRRDPITNKWDFHYGVDFKANYGQQIVATGKGKVVAAKYSSIYGYYILIDHGYGYKTRYAHNSKNLVKVGDIVDRGTVIAKAGSTGRSTGVHLHYEVIENGICVDPENYLE